MPNVHIYTCKLACHSTTGFAPAQQQTMTQLRQVYITTSFHDQFMASQSISAAWWPATSPPGPPHHAAANLHVGAGSPEHQLPSDSQLCLVRPTHAPGPACRYSAEISRRRSPRQRRSRRCGRTTTSRSSTLCLRP